MKDVKTYLSTVGNRITRAFSIEEFELEQELEFWSLSAEHMSRKTNPSFTDIVNWIDLLYSAPVHIVYKKEENEDELILFKRQINSWNILRKEKQDEKHIKYTAKDRLKVNEFEQTIQNLQNKKKWYPEYREHGIFSHSIGNCEHIPIYKKDGTIWGIYVVGPGTKCPEIMVPKLSIVGRLLSIWLMAIDEDEQHSLNTYKEKMDLIVSELGSGALNIEALSGFCLRFLVNVSQAKGGAVFTLRSGVPVRETSTGLSDEQIKEIIGGEIIQAGDTPVLPKEGEAPLLGAYTIIPFTGNDYSGFILLSGIENKPDQVITGIIQNQLAALFDFGDVNSTFTEGLISSYYQMLRTLESKREQTRYHTLRLLSFVERFALLFGLDDLETEMIVTTAKLHDIGYVGGLSVDTDQSISKELSHPLTGYKLIEQLPLPKEVKEGVLTHHEWVNGQGSPMGFEGSEIPWTGKIISIFEYIVEFIESNQGSTTQSSEQWMQVLTQSIIERADKQFDMVLVPTVVELLKSLGWETCCVLGTE